VTIYVEIIGYALITSSSMNIEAGHGGSSVAGLGN
jgi:hypothetical protein